MRCFEYGPAFAMSMCTLTACKLQRPNLENSEAYPNCLQTSGTKLWKLRSWKYTLINHNIENNHGVDKDHWFVCCFECGPAVAMSMCTLTACKLQKPQFCILVVQNLWSEFCFYETRICTVIMHPKRLSVLKTCRTHDVNLFPCT